MQLDQAVVTQLINTIVQLSLVILSWLLSYATAKVAGWFNARKNEIKDKAGVVAWDFLKAQAQVFVDAAEQLGITGQIDDKKDYVLEQLAEFAKKYNIEVSSGQLEALLESSVLNGLSYIVKPEEKQ